MGNLARAVSPKPQIRGQTEEDHHCQGEFDKTVVGGAQSPREISEAREGQHLRCHLPGDQKEKIERQFAPRVVVRGGSAGGEDWSIQHWGHYCRH